MELIVHPEAKNGVGEMVVRGDLPPSRADGGIGRRNRLRRGDEPAVDHLAALLSVLLDVMPNLPSRWFALGRGYRQAPELLRKP